MSTLTVCNANEKNIVILEQYENITYTKMIKIFGVPMDKTGYTIKNAPTKSWNHKELFSKYPKTKENENIQIMEVVWDDNTHVIFACFHIIDGENQCLVAKRIVKGIKY
jgi:hypothetical protein